MRMYDFAWHFHWDPPDYNESPVMTVVTLLISKTKKSNNVTKCRTKGVYQAQSASSYALILYYTESLQEDDTKDLTCATHLSMIQ